MAQRVEEPVVKATDLSVIPGTHITERDNSCKLSFDFYTGVANTYLDTRINTWFFIKVYIEPSMYTIKAQAD